MVRKAGLGTDGSKLRHHDLDLIPGAVLIGPSLDFRKLGMDACRGVFIGVFTLDRTLHFAVPISARRLAASSPRNWPTSVTMPTACPVPRSLTLVTTAGLMSTHTILTQLGSMFPVAMECSMDPRHSTKPAPLSCSA